VKELSFNFNLLDLQMCHLMNSIGDSIVDTEEHQTIAACLYDLLQHCINLQNLKLKCFALDTCSENVIVNKSSTKLEIENATIDYATVLPQLFDRLPSLTDLVFQDVYFHYSQKLSNKNIISIDMPDKKFKSIRCISRSSYSSALVLKLVTGGYKKHIYCIGNATSGLYLATDNDYQELLDYTQYTSFDVTCRELSYFSTSSLQAGKAKQSIKLA
jgi:hypothetical protein